ncbi:MAG: hypothetical protein EHM93_14315 [Bacteroidales bacterium]|nr:MAG: hypothetical protein EHM93_14315 [Bacteroidales bacterium]
MKSITKILLLCFTATLIVASCKKDDNGPDKIIVKLGAQSNATIGSFYSLGENKVYTQELAAENQDTIDFLCFYEHAEPNRINDITLASPGATITGIFTGTTEPNSWTTKNLTKFQDPSTEITIEEFDLLDQNDATIDSYFDNTVTGGNKKAKLLTAGDIYAFKTCDNIYGLLKVISVGQNPDGYVEFEVKYKK